MKKDKEWAQKEVDRYLSYEGVNEARNALAFAKGVINQLDEPEVLSQEEVVVTYFSPFTELPVMVETETHKYMIEVTKTIEMED